VLTFEPLPKEALGYSESRVLTDDERLCAFESMGINQIIKLPFEKIKDLEPERFFPDTLRMFKPSWWAKTFVLGVTP